MPYPEKLLHGNESVVLDLRPHWITMAPATAGLLAASIFGIVAAASSWPDAVRWLALIVVVAALVWWVARLIRWASTMFVLTTDRLISREGILRKSGIEIPLERINTVFFSQKIYERMVGAGDLEVESASERGTQRFDNIRKPDIVQREIYVQMEDNENRKFDRINTGAGLSPVEQVEKLQALLAQGTITPEQFEAERARILGVVTAPAPSADGPRLVSLVPSVTETLLAWGRRPVACTRFCEQPGIPTVGGTKRPRLEAIVALAPDAVVMCDEENRREDHDALVAAGVRVHVASPRSVDDVPDVLDALAAVAQVDPPVLREPRVDPSPVAARRAFVPIWARPWMTLNADTYGASVLAAAGWESAWADDPVRYPEVTVEEVRARDVAAVLAPTEPYAFTDDDLPGLSERFGAPAVLVDGKDLFWWGVRTDAAVARLVAALARPT